MPSVSITSFLKLNRKTFCSMAVCTLHQPLHNVRTPPGVSFVIFNVKGTQAKTIQTREFYDWKVVEQE